MENYIANRIGTSRSVRSTLLEYKPLWEHIPIFGTYYVVIDDGITAIETDETIIEGINSGVAKDKLKKEQAMVMAALKVSGAGYAYASDNNDEILMGKMNITKSDFSNKLDEAEGALAGEIFEAIKPIIDLLTDYPVTAADLDDLKAKKEDYVSVVRAPRDTRNDGKDARADVRKQLKTIFTTFGKIDKLMINFDNDAGASFHKKYFDSREIVDLGKGHATAVLNFEAGKGVALTVFEGKFEAGDSILVRNQSKEDAIAGLTSLANTAPATTAPIIKGGTDMVLEIPKDANIINLRFFSVVAKYIYKNAKITVFLIKGKSQSKATHVVITGFPK